MQYESCRGLEGWTVVCLELDRLIASKLREYAEEPEEQLSLPLSTPQEKAEEFAYLWALIPLTRAIDTLVISLHDKNSRLGVILKELHLIHPDFIEWIEAKA